MTSEFVSRDRDRHQNVLDRGTHNTIGQVQAFSRKRKRVHRSSLLSTETVDPLQDAIRQFLQFELSVQLPQTSYPRALYDGWSSEVVECSEARALRHLKREWLDADNVRALEDDETYITLTQFCVYRQRDKMSAGTMASLNDLMTRSSDSSLLFSGVLREDSKQCFVRDVPFEILSIAGYELDVCSVSDCIYIQSYIGKELGVWYHLTSEPALEYRRFHSEFLWLADFGKHFACYLLSHAHVRLIDFERHFHAWLLENYSLEPSFMQWLAEYGGADFRKVVVNNPIYLHRESTNPGVDLHGKNHEHFIWREIHPDLLDAIPMQSYPLEAPTIVTEYIYNNFKEFYFADQLEARNPNVSVHKASVAQWQASLSMSYLGATDSSPSSSLAGNTDLGKRKVEIGDFIGVGRDSKGSWKDKAAVWYAYVHDIESDKRERNVLHILWLYRPHDTICSAMRYPHANELFLSDHCNCRCKKGDRLYEDEVNESPRVKFSVSPIPEDEGYFIRQTYVTQDAANQFVALKHEHLTCEHRKDSPPSSVNQYQPGDTVLIVSPDQSCLEPEEIISIHGNNVKSRPLFRRERDCGIPGKTNELVYSDQVSLSYVYQIIRRCYVRFYTRAEVEEDRLPAPYKYNGEGDCWIVTATCKDGIVTDLQRPFPPSLRQGFDPMSRSPDDAPSLPTLDLFCGAGFLSRGIENSGVASAKWHVDLDKVAIHTARANSKDPNAESFFWGSAVQYMALAMDGKYSRYVATVGAVSLIIAGSPCQGFSNLQPDKTSLRSRKNASMVALALSFIDLYRPKYAILENVFGMTRPLGEKRDQHVFAQIICALVGMGYQTQAFHLDAFNYGDPQRRSRIFITIAAPGHEPLPIPQHTHASPNDIASRSIGITVNGERYGNREIQIAPFPFVSAAAATRHLAAIGDGTVGLCVKFPDHRLARHLNWKHTGIIRCVPRFPRGMGIIKAIRTGVISEDSVKDLKRFTSLWKMASTNKAYTRVDPDNLFSTVVTACTFDDAMEGRFLHWDEPRPLTVAEARIAQGVPEDEIIIGLASEQWKQIGNGVARGVSTMLGVLLREAWSQTWNQSRRNRPQTSAAQYGKLTGAAQDNRKPSITSPVPLDLENRDVSSEGDHSHDASLPDKPYCPQHLSLAPNRRLESIVGSDDTFAFRNTSLAIRPSFRRPHLLPSRPYPTSSTSNPIFAVASSDPGNFSANTPLSTSSAPTAANSEDVSSHGNTSDLIVVCDDSSESSLSPLAREEQQIVHEEPSVLIETQGREDSSSVTSIPIKRVAIAGSDPKRPVVISALKSFTTVGD